MIHPADICIIVPAFNEQEAIKQTLNDLLLYGYIIIVVDDASEDNTYDEIHDLPIYYIKHLTNLGQGAAIQTGLEFAKTLKCKYFVSFDADGQHSPEDILPMVIFLANNNLDIVFGSRFLGVKPKNLSFTRKIVLKTAILVNYLFSGVLLSDAHNGLRAMNIKFIHEVILTENRMAHATEILIKTKKQGMKFAEYPCHIRYTAYSIKKGQSALNSASVLHSILLNKLFR